MLVFQSLQGLRLGGTDRRAAALFFFFPFLKKNAFFPLQARQSQFQPPWSTTYTAVHHIETNQPNLYHNFTARRACLV